MRRRFLAAVVAAGLAALPAAAHEGHVHKLMGTVTAVHADAGHVEIKDTKGAAQSFYVDKATRILKGTTAVALAELKVGARVVVDAKTTGGKLLATQVRLGGVPAAKH